MIANSIVCSVVRDCEETLQESRCSDDMAKTQQSENVEAFEGTKQTITHNLTSETLQQIDHEGKGEISSGMLRRAAREIRHLKRVVALLCLLAAFFLIGVLAASYIAIEMSKEMHVHNGLLVDTSEHGVSTVQKLDSVAGIRSGLARRLGNSSNASQNFSNVTGSSDYSSISQHDSNTTGAYDYSDLIIDSATFYDTVEGYVTGRAPDWVVPLPDGTVRTISIQGSSSHSAWGVCGICHVSLVWTVSCPGHSNSSDSCPISWELQEEIVYGSAYSDSAARRLRGSTTEQSQGAMSTRAARTRSEEFGESMDRSLTGKSCV